MNIVKHIKKRNQALKICETCPMRKPNDGEWPFLATCGEYVKPVEGVSCGCIISLKTLFVDLLKCPQKKW